MSSASSPSSYKKNAAARQSGHNPKVRLVSYPWYFEDWLCSETSAAMTLAERGLYRELLDLCWYHGSLPTDLHTLFAMARTDVKLRRNSSKTDRKLIENALKTFVILEDGRYHHPKVDEKRNQLIGYKLERKEAGKKGGFAKAKRASSARAQLKPSPSPSPTKRAAAEKSSGVVAPRKPNTAAAAAKQNARKPAASEKPENWSPYTAAFVDDWRQMLNWHARLCKLPPIDDYMLRGLIDLTRGASAPDVHHLLKELHHRGRFNDVRSWGYFPVLLRQFFEPSRAASAGAD